MRKYIVLLYSLLFLGIAGETRALQEEKQSGCGVCAEDDRAPG